MKAFDILSRGGSLVKRDTDTHAVSHWHIPRGSDYNKAFVVTTFWPDYESAQEFVDVYGNTEHMAAHCSMEEACKIFKSK